MRKDDSKTVSLAEGDSKTVNGIKVIIHHITETRVYYLQGRADKPVEELARVWRDRDEFEQMWEAEI